MLTPEIAGSRERAATRGGRQEGGTSPPGSRGEPGETRNPRSEPQGARTPGNSIQDTRARAGGLFFAVQDLNEK